MVILEIDPPYLVTLIGRGARFRVVNMWGGWSGEKGVAVVACAH